MRSRRSGTTAGRSPVASATALPARPQAGVSAYGWQEEQSKSWAHDGRQDRPNRQSVPAGASAAVPSMVVDNLGTARAQPNSSREGHEASRSARTVAECSRVRDQRSARSQVSSSSERVSTGDSRSEPSRASSTSPAPDTLANVTYVLPLRHTTLHHDDQELARYLRHLAELVEVVVADGSPHDVFAAHRAMWDPAVRQVPVISCCLNGKVAGVIDGAFAASNDLLVIADDDVRHDRQSLTAVAALLAEHEVVRPQNFFSPLPWHAQWDSARSLLNRAFADDYPGTLGVRRSALETAGGYCGAILFENLELIRTLRAHGFSHGRATNVFVRRLPPTSRHFWEQRVRQAYDSRAQPARQLAELALAPAAWWTMHIRRPSLLALAAGATVVLAELGRRRQGGREVFPWTISWWAPAWVAERAITSWVAQFERLRGGAFFAGGRLKGAAHSERSLTHSNCPERSCSCDTVWRPRIAGRSASKLPADGDASQGMSLESNLGAAPLHERNSRAAHEPSFVRR